MTTTPRSRPTRRFDVTTAIDTTMTTARNYYRFLFCLLSREGGGYEIFIQMGLLRGCFPVFWTISSAIHAAVRAGRPTQPTPGRPGVHHAVGVVPGLPTQQRPISQSSHTRKQGKNKRSKKTRPGDAISEGQPSKMSQFAKMFAHRGQEGTQWTFIFARQPACPALLLWPMVMIVIFERQATCPGGHLFCHRRRGKLVQQSH